MKSPITGKDMILISEPDVWNFRREEYQYTHKLYLCEDSEERFTTTERDMEWWNEVTGTYCKKHNIPTQEELISLRLKTGLLTQEIENFIGLNPNRYKDFELGEDPTLDENNKINIYLNNIK